MTCLCFQCGPTISTPTVKIVLVAKSQTCVLQKSAHSKLAIFLVSPNKCLVHTYIYQNSLSLLFCARSTACARNGVDLRRFLIFKKEKSERCFPHPIRAEKGQAILKFALSEVSEFQLEDKSTEGKFALGQEKSAPTQRGR